MSVPPICLTHAVINGFCTRCGWTLPLEAANAPIVTFLKDQQAAIDELQKENAQLRAELKKFHDGLAMEAQTVPGCSLRRGDRVKKSKGFEFPGIVDCVFLTQAGAIRCAVEADHPDFKGMLHIYDPAQLEPR